LAAVLQQLLEDASYRERLGREASRASRSHFRWDNTRHEYDSLIHGLVS
jgi:glycosyltransferase involved in cell wall biosynthesis